MGKTIKYRCPECKTERSFEEGTLVVCQKSIGEKATCHGHESMVPVPVPVAEATKEEKASPANA